MTLETTAQLHRDYKRVKSAAMTWICWLRSSMPCFQALLSTRASGIINEREARGITGSATLQPDWLLMYRIERKRLVLVANRTGTHSDLFDD